MNIVKVEVTHQLLALFLYTSHKLSKMKTKEISFMRNLSCIIITKIKCSAINLPKETNDLHIANYKPLMKETKDTKKW